MGKDPIKCSFSLVFLFQISITERKSTLKTERVQSEKNIRLSTLCSQWNCVTSPLALNSAWMVKWEVSPCTKRWTHRFFHKDHPWSPTALRCCRLPFWQGSNRSNQFPKQCSLEQGDTEEIWKSNAPKKHHLLSCLQRHPWHWAVRTREFMCCICRK